MAQAFLVQADSVKYHKDYLWEFDGPQLDDAGIAYWKSHIDFEDRRKERRSHYTYLFPDRVQRQSALWSQLKDWGQVYGLEIVYISAFAGIKGERSGIHIDTRENKPRPVRLNFPLNMFSGTMAWYEEIPEDKLIWEVGNPAKPNEKYLVPPKYETPPTPVWTSQLPVNQGYWVRTDIPHVVDFKGVPVNRAVLSVSFLPNISWQELIDRIVPDAV